MDKRVRIPRDKAELVERLTKGEANPNGPFRTKADVMAFSAAYGFHSGAGRPFEENVDPIRLEVFERRGYDSLFYVLALADTRDPKCLGQSEEALDVRLKTFEEYANGGLDLLEGQLRGFDDPLDRLLLIINEVQRASSENGQEFDLAHIFG